METLDGANCNTIRKSTFLAVIGYNCCHGFLLLWFSQPRAGLIYQSMAYRLIQHVNRSLKLSKGRIVFLFMMADI
jgi:hypothetical protein